MSSYPCHKDTTFSYEEYRVSYKHKFSPCLFLEKNLPVNLASSTLTCIETHFKHDFEMCDICILAALGCNIHTSTEFIKTKKNSSLIMILT